MITCEQAATICNKSQYNEASFSEKMRLRLHLLVCKTCAGFTRKNKKLTSLCHKAPLHTLSEDYKNELKDRLKLYR
jgi:hypothetical protein